VLVPGLFGGLADKALGIEKVRRFQWSAWQHPTDKLVSWHLNECAPIEVHSKITQDSIRSSLIVCKPQLSESSITGRKKTRNAAGYELQGHRNPLLAIFLSWKGI
jgi:hypothetical protein